MTKSASRAQAGHLDRLTRLCGELADLKLLDLGAPEHAPAPHAVWSQFIGLSHQPTRALKRPAPLPDVVQALSSGPDAWEGAWEVGDHLWLSVGGLGSAWAHVEILAAGWLQPLLARCPALELVILAEDLSRGVAITEEEYEIYLYILDPGPQPGVFQIRR